MTDELRMSAYYYSFEPTNCRPVDEILSAVAIAGKRFHNTEEWDNEAIDGIQNAAKRAANAHDDLVAALEGIIACEDTGDYGGLCDADMGEDNGPSPFQSAKLRVAMQQARAALEKAKP